MMSPAAPEGAGHICVDELRSNGRNGHRTRHAKHAREGRGDSVNGGIPAPTAAQDAKFAPFARKCPSKVRGWSIGREKRERDTND